MEKKKIHICSIVNAKSKKCSEGCSFCAQTIHCHNEGENFEFDERKCIEAAYEAKLNGAECLGIVVTGKGYFTNTEEFSTIISTIKAVKSKIRINVCASLGILGEENVVELKKAGIEFYHHHIQTNPTKYAKLVNAKHDVQERINTIKLLRKHKIKICSEGILGLGENWFDRFKMALFFRKNKIESIPINKLIPLEGNLFDKSFISESEFVMALKLIKFFNPKSIVKIGAGKNQINYEKQFCLLKNKNVDGFILGNMLTTSGAILEDDKKLIEKVIKSR